MRALAPTTERRTPLAPADACWIWTGSRHSEGYGIVMVDGSTRFVHRLAYQLHVGPIHRGYQVDHICHNLAAAAGKCAGGADCIHRACWNPAHLESVTSRENSMRGTHPLFALARSSHCRRGHDMSDPLHLQIRSNGTRRCRTCQRDRARERRKAA